MDFVPVYEDETGPSSGPAVSGRAVVSLTPERRSLLGVRSEEVREMRIEKSLRAVGRVTADERRLAHVHTKFEGYVERLYVDFTGMLVNKGDPLLSIYSPDLVATQQEYLLALRAQRQLGNSQIPSVAQAVRACSRPRANASACGTSARRTSRRSSGPGRFAAHWISTRRSRGT